MEHDDQTVDDLDIEIANLRVGLKETKKLLEQHDDEYRRWVGEHNEVMARMKKREIKHHDHVTRLKQHIKELRRENNVLRKAAGTTDFEALLERVLPRIRVRPEVHDFAGRTTWEVVLAEKNKEI